MRRASRITGPLLAVLTMALGSPATAQADLSGEWAGDLFEDLPHRGGMQPGDYTGLPLNEAGWRKAESWDDAVAATHERQCLPHIHAFQARGPRHVVESGTVRCEIRQEPWS